MTKAAAIRALVAAAQLTARTHAEHSHLWLAANRAARALGMPESPAVQTSPLAQRIPGLTGIPASELARRGHR